MTDPTPAPDRSTLRVRQRAASLVAVACLALVLAACSASDSSSGQLPTGPTPSISVLLRVGGGAATTVQLLGAGTSQEALDAAAGAVARAAFPNAQVGSPETAAQTDPGLTVATVPVQLPTGAMAFNLDSGSISSALKAAHPKAIGVWVCTDNRRSLTVDTTAPGAVSSDVVSGQCQVAGSTLAHDGLTWTAAVSVGPIEPPSKLPWLIGAAIVVALIAGGIWLMRTRRAPEETIGSPPMPPRPPLH